MINKITKEFLIREYIKNNKSMRIIANKLNCSISPIFSYLKKYNIIKEKISTKEYYCKDCGKKICYQTALYSKGKCKSCTQIGKKVSLKTRKKMSINSTKSNYIDGRYSKVYYCIESGCNNKISYPNWLYGKRRCSSCGKKGKRNHRYGISLKGKNNGNYKDGKTTKIYYCKEKNCNNKISYYSVYCGEGRCHSCAGKYNWKNKKYQNRDIKGKNNSNWKGGISKLPYSFEFNDKLKLKIRTRDNFECQNCKMTEEEHISVCGAVLCVHHIDYNKMNCKENNLTSLCNGCNIRVNFNRDYWFSYFTYIMENNINYD